MERTPPGTSAPLGSGPVLPPVSEGGRGLDKQPPPPSLWSHHPPWALPADTEVERMQGPARAPRWEPPLGLLTSLPSVWSVRHPQPSLMSWRWSGGKSPRLP